MQSICDKIVMLRHGEAIHLDHMSTTNSLTIDFKTPVCEARLISLQQHFGEQAVTPSQIKIKPESNQALLNSLTMLEQWEIEIHEIHYQADSLTEYYLSLMEQHDPSKH